MSDLSGRRSVVVLAGPNGSGKSTIAPSLLKGRLRVFEFVNADRIAQGLSGFAAEGAAITAGRVMLARLKDLARQRVSFAYETTLASRSFAPWIEGLIGLGYRFDLVFLWLPSPQLALARVADRVRMGGHDVPEETVRRRYAAGLVNFFRIYRPLATIWRMYDNSKPGRMDLIAAGAGTRITRAVRPETWKTIRRQYDHGI